MSGSKQGSRAAKGNSKPAAKPASESAQESVQAEQPTATDSEHSDGGHAADASVHPDTGGATASPADSEAAVSGSAGDGQHNPRGEGDDPAASGSDESKAAGEPLKPRIIPVLYVQTARGVARFRRAGMTFGPQRERLARETLSDEQVEALLNEPNLIVEEDDYEVGSED